MRCACYRCGTYMNQAESTHLGCVCPECGYRCKACLGTNTVVSREKLADLKFDAQLMQDIFSSFDADDAYEDRGRFDNHDARPIDESPDKWGDEQWTD